ncbi:MAG TPA: class I SAM-dependent rRNA methyltransferase [Myxococcota bacterium]|nr:class I SAM-dependent rRNA methyltransferase [Myxococcota bacterium]
MFDVVLKPGRDRSLRRRHPWLLDGSVARVDGTPESGDWVRICAESGEILGYGFYSPASRLRVRVLQFGKEPPAESLLEERIAAAIAKRASDPLLQGTDALRLVNAEGDALPGLVADRYGDVVVVRLGSAGMARRRDAIAAALQRESGARFGVLRPDAAAARREGIAAEGGALWGGDAPARIEIEERDRRYLVDVAHGQKTGFYLDQRDARDLVMRLSAGRRVLDLFAYTGGFAVAAARGGAASLCLVESSADALALARENLARNEAAIPAELVRGDAFEFARAQGERFDLIVVDPPPLARAHRDVASAARAHKDVLLGALRRAAPGAWLLAFSCSHHVGQELFAKIAAGAATDAHRDVQVEGVLGAPSDHPVSLHHPEGGYLAGLLLRA